MYYPLFYIIHLLISVGYIGDKSFLEQVHSVALELKEKNKDLMFVCDPVLGDNGAYVCLVYRRLSVILFGIINYYWSDN